MNPAGSRPRRDRDVAFKSGISLGRGMHPILALVRHRSGRHVASWGVGNVPSQSNPCFSHDLHDFASSELDGKGSSCGGSRRRNDLQNQVIDQLRSVSDLRNVAGQIQDDSRVNFGGPYGRWIFRSSYCSTSRLVKNQPSERTHRKTENTGNLWMHAILNWSDYRPVRLRKLDGDRTERTHGPGLGNHQSVGVTLAKRSQFLRLLLDSRRTNFSCALGTPDPIKKHQIDACAQ